MPARAATGSFLGRSWTFHFFDAVFGLLKTTPYFLDLVPVEMPGKDARWIRGRVVAAPRGLVAPLSGQPCVAFRISGATEWGLLDDSDLASFTMETDAHDETDVGPGPALVDAPLGEETTPEGDAADRLSAFLAPRGLAGEATVREGVVRVGDRIEVYGALSDRAAGDGYRSSKQRTVIRPGLVHPLALRVLAASGGG